MAVQVAAVSLEPLDVDELGMAKAAILFLLQEHAEWGFIDEADDLINLVSAYNGLEAQMAQLEDRPVLTITGDEILV